MTIQDGIMLETFPKTKAKAKQCWEEFLAI